MRLYFYYPHTHTRPSFPKDPLCRPKIIQTFTLLDLHHFYPSHCRPTAVPLPSQIRLFPLFRWNCVGLCRPNVVIASLYVGDAAINLTILKKILLFFKIKTIYLVGGEILPELDLWGENNDLLSTTTTY